MLNRMQPYGEVYGMSGISWEQGGQLFDFAGFPVDGMGNRVEVATAVPAPATDGLEGMHHKSLAAMLSQYGEPYTSREAAIAFIRRRKVAA